MAGKLQYNSVRSRIIMILRNKMGPLRPVQIARYITLKLENEDKIIKRKRIVAIELVKMKKIGLVVKNGNGYELNKVTSTDDYVKMLSEVTVKVENEKKTSLRIRILDRLSLIKHPISPVEIADWLIMNNHGAIKKGILIALTEKSKQILKNCNDGDSIKYDLRLATHKSFILLHKKSINNLKQAVRVELCRQLKKGTIRNINGKYEII